MQRRLLVTALLAATLAACSGQAPAPATGDTADQAAPSAEDAAFADLSERWLDGVMQIAPVVDHVEYRNQLASLAQRAKFFIAYRGLVNKPKVTQHEVGVRYYEGAASGTLLLGEAPQNEVFPQLFDWPDPVIHLPYGSSDGPRVMAETLADAERVAEMRKNNVAHSLARHDTAHRWKDVLELLNMPLQQPHRERLAYLQEQSNRVHQNAIDFRD